MRNILAGPLALLRVVAWLPLTALKGVLGALALLALYTVTQDIAFGHPFEAVVDFLFGTVMAVGLSAAMYAHNRLRHSISGEDPHV